MDKPVSRTLFVKMSDSMKAKKSDVYIVTVNTSISEKSKEEPYNPSEHRHVEHPTTNADTLLHLLKAFVGTGMLAIPNAFVNAGLWVGIVFLLLIAGICVHAMTILINCSSTLCQRFRLPYVDYATCAELSCKSGPAVFQKFQKGSRLTMNIFISVTQLGFCCVYFVFMAENMKQVCDFYFPSYLLDVRYYILIFLVPVILLNFIRNLKYLVPFSMLANGMMAASIIIILYYSCQDLPPISERNASAPLTKFPLYFGTVIFAFEGVGVILPLENNMKTPNSMRGWNGVMNTGMLIVFLLYATIGFMGYWKYGDDALGSVTLNLPTGDVLAQVVKLLLSLCVFITYSIQFFVPVEIMLPGVQARIKNPKYHLFADYALRSILVFITFVLAEAIPNIALFISLVGSVSSTALTLIFPPIFEILTFYYYGISKWTIGKNACILTFGIIGCVTGTYVSVVQIIQSF